MPGRYRRRKAPFSRSEKHENRLQGIGGGVFPTLDSRYKCVCNGGNIVLDPAEHDGYQWITYNDIGKLKCIAFLKNLLRNYALDAI